MRSSEMCAWTRKLAAGGKDRSSLRRSLNSAAGWSAICGRFYGLRAYGSRIIAVGPFRIERRPSALQGGRRALFEQRGAEQPAERREDRPDAQHEHESD